MPTPRVRPLRAPFAVAAEIHVRHPSPQATKSCIANFESPTIAWPALLSSWTCRRRALATAASIASPPGSGTHVSRILARLSTNANRACWDLPRRNISRRTCSMLAASRSSAPIIVSSRPLNSCSIAALRKALGLAYPRSFTVDWSRSSVSAVNRIVRLDIFAPLLRKVMTEALRDKS